MHILLMAQHFAPEDVSGAALVTQFAADLVGSGHKVNVVTCFPNYPKGIVYPGYHHSLYLREQSEGAFVVRIWSYLSPQKTIYRRMLNYGTFSLASFWGGLLAGKPDLIFCYSPPLPLGLSAWLLSRLWRVPWILRVEDLFPDAAVVSGYLTNRTVIKCFSAFEKFLYQKADHISLISEGFRQNLIAKGVPARKLTVVPVWADPDLIRPEERENKFRQQHGLNGHFVVLYAGNMGLTSCLEDVLQAAVKLSDHPEIQFLFVGEGMKKASLQDYALEKSLENVRFLPFQPREGISNMLAAADIGVVTLNERSAPYSLPCKTFNLMASGRPLLSISPPQSELASLIEGTGCGVNVPTGEVEALCSVILELKNSPERLREMGGRGREALERDYSREKCTSAFEQSINNAAVHRLQNR